MSNRRLLACDGCGLAWDNAENASMARCPSCGGTLALYTEGRDSFPLEEWPEEIS